MALDVFREREKKPFGSARSRAFGRVFVCAVDQGPMLHTSRKILTEACIVPVRLSKSGSRVV